MNLSVIVPVFNGASYIQKCLDALSNQSFKDFEVVIVDDCSSDNTVKVIKDYKLSSNLDISLIKNPRNLGPSLSREAGIKVAKGSFICFCDADDWYDPDFLKSLYDASIVKNLDLCFCGYRLVSDSGKTSERDVLLNEEDCLDKRQVLIKSGDSLCTLIVKKDIIENIPKPDIRSGEDMAIIPLIIVKSNRIGVVNQNLYNYYSRESSSSHTANISQINSLIKSFEFIDSNLPSIYYLEKEFLGIRNLLYGALINLYKFSSDSKLADSILSKFQSNYPNWKKNPYLSLLSTPKRLFLFCIKNNLSLPAKILSKLHAKLTK